MRTLSSILIIFISPFMVLAQKASAPKERADTVRNKFAPTGVRIGTDLIDIIKDKYVDSFTGWEVNGDIDFSRYYLAVDYGSWGRNYFYDSTATLSSGYYSNTGRYYRVGIDVNFLTKDPEKNMFFIGFRYGRSVFSEQLITLPGIDSNWIGRTGATYNNDNVKGHWLELTSGIRVRMWKFIWMGYTARFKFGLKTSNTPEMLPSDVPGFGRTNKETTWGFNYQLFVRLPLPKKK